jgi:hypothetical protein
MTGLQHGALQELEPLVEAGHLLRHIPAASLRQHLVDGGGMLVRTALDVQARQSRQMLHLPGSNRSFAAAGNLGRALIASAEQILLSPEQLTEQAQALAVTFRKF